MTLEISDDQRSFANNLHVAFLVNFVAPNHIAIFREVKRHVGQLSILSSVAMESNREFDSETGGLDVIVQNTKTITRTARHPSGYEDVNYIHIPLDTIGQLRRLKPDVIVSLELGARTIASVTYRLLNRKCAVVAAVCASERSEAGRGLIRRMTRSRLLHRADWVTYNGPSCQQYLLGLGANRDRMSAWDYAADPEKMYRGDVSRTFDPASIRLLTVGQLSKRKGVMEGIEQLAQWAKENPQRRIEWNLLGNGPLESDMRQFPMTENLTVHFHGHVGADAIRDQYRDNDFLFFPTLGDEWGLVVDEALISGLPVIGSIHSQAVATIIQEGGNGWSFDPEKTGSLSNAMTQASNQSEDARLAMIRNARDSASARTPETSAMQFLDAVHRAAKIRLG
jgi:glycosyltransferase involved in cell wall biosynthesis